MITTKSILLLLLIPIQQSFMFGQEVSVKMGQDMCECANEREVENEDDGLDRIFKCLRSISEKYEAEVFNLAPKKYIDSIALNSITPYQEGQKMGRELGKKVFIESQEYLIKNCDSYFNFFLSLRQKKRQKLKEQSKNIKIRSFNKKIKKDSDIDSHLKRGIYYLAKGKHKKAIKDFNKCADAKPENPYIWYLLAQTYEEANDYEMAISKYKKSLTLKDDILVKINYEITKRKWRESM